MFDKYKAIAIGHVRSKTASLADDLVALLQPMAEEMVNDAVYTEAVNAGQDALDEAMTALADDALAEIVDGVTEYVAEYADDVPERMAERVQKLVDEGDGEGALEALGADLEGFRYSVERYAEPIIAAGMESYGSGLDNNDVLLVWQLNGEDNCATCPEFAAGSPYTADAIPAWPKSGDSECRDNCLCSIEADPETWDAFMGQDSAPADEG